MSTAQCVQCGEVKSLDSFSLRETGKPRRDCKPCRAATQRLYVDRNRDRVYANNRARRREILELIRSAKDRPCADCGVHYPKWVMDFHHALGAKEFTVSQALARGFSMRKVQAEIAKCVVLCANCHRLRHGDRTRD